jgi:hypothetical protein
MFITDSTKSHRDYKRQFKFTDGDKNSDTYGQLIDFTGASISIAIHDQDHCELILATTDNGMVSIVSTGVVELAIDQSNMGMPPGYYQLGGYYQLNGETNDLFEGELAVQLGIPKP